MTTGDLELRIAWERHIGTGTSADRWYESIVARHREAQRHYHDLRHVRWVVRHVLELDAEHPVDDLDAVIAAAFLHDVIYDPTASGNEAASAELAARALRELGWPDDRVDRVTAMIVGTAHHRIDETTSIDSAVLYAADLGVLAADPAGYSDYVRNVRREYHHVDDQDWVVGRVSILRSFLARQAIYAPDLELRSWEQRARGNLTAELEALGGSVSRGG